MTHYRILRPLETHWRPATCEDVDCTAYSRGWATIVPEVSPQARYIRQHSEREFTEESTEGGLVAFTFPPGQQCFKSHKLPREDTAPLFTKETPGRHRRLGFENWADDFNEAAYQFNEWKKRG